MLDRHLLPVGIEESDDAANGLAAPN
jgi:hypothetical protein